MRYLRYLCMTVCFVAWLRFYVLWFFRFTEFSSMEILQHLWIEVIAMIVSMLAAMVFAAYEGYL